jgi:hypothetical protein
MPTPIFLRGDSKFFTRRGQMSATSEFRDARVRVWRLRSGVQREK